MNFKGIIGKLISDGDLVLYHDYRGGTATDLSGQGNDGAYTGTAWSGSDRGIGFPETTSNIIAADSSELQLSEGTMVVLGEFSSQEDFEALIYKRDAGGSNYGMYLRDSGGLGISFYGTGGVTTAQPILVAGKHYIGCNFEHNVAASFYIDGLFNRDATTSTTVVADDAPVYIGNYYSNSFNLNSTLYAALIINRKLTATEHSQLYAQLQSMSWPSKSKSFGKVELPIDSDEDGLLAAWNMKNVNGEIIDESGNGNDGTVAGALQTKNILGDAMKFDGIDDYVHIGTSPLITTTDYTISTWLSVATTAGDEAIFANDNTTSDEIIDTLGIRAGYIAWNYTAAGTFKQVSSILIGDNAPHHVVLTSDGGRSGTVKLYIDGVEDTGVGAGAFYISGTSASIGARNTDITPARFLDGTINSLELYSDVKDHAWVKKQYAQGARALNFSTNYSIPDTVSNISSGQIPGSPVYVDSGTWSVSTSDELIDSKVVSGVKVLTCETAGICYIKSSDMFGSSTEMAYGTWEFDWYLADDVTSSLINFVSDSVQAYNAFIGYGLQINTATSLQRAVYSSGGGGSTLADFADDPFIADAWNKVKITRTAAGVFNFYINDVLSGTGTNANYTSSGYFVLDFQAGDKIVLSSLDKQWAIRKQLGAIS